MTHVDYHNIEIDGRRVRLKDPAATIDLGGIAKGYIADRTAEFLQEKGVTSAIVDLGGNIVIIGQKGTSLQDGAGSDFSIGIASPVSGRGELLGAVTCSDKTVVTSGTYERYFEIDGVRYHHVLDPETATRSPRICWRSRSSASAACRLTATASARPVWLWAAKRLPL